MLGLGLGAWGMGPRGRERGALDHHKNFCVWSKGPFMDPYVWTPVYGSRYMDPSIWTPGMDPLYGPYYVWLGAEGIFVYMYIVLVCHLCIICESYLQ